MSQLFDDFKTSENNETAHNLLANIFQLVKKRDSD